MAANRTAVLAVLVSAALLLVGATAPGAAHPGNTGPGGDTSATARTDSRPRQGYKNGHAHRLPGHSLRGTAHRHPPLGRPTPGEPLDRRKGRDAAGAAVSPGRLGLRGRVEPG